MFRKPREVDDITSIPLDVLRLRETTVQALTDVWGRILDVLCDVSSDSPTSDLPFL